MRKSILAGISIGIAGFGYLASKDIIGAVLFSFGLLTVVHYQLRLYTGTAGFIHKGEIKDLLMILLGNIIGCLIIALIARCSPLGLQDTAQGIIESRIVNGAVKDGILAIGCGFIMTTAVTFARKEQYLPLLFGVPLFIMCGFPHCVADVFYILSIPLSFLMENMADIIMYYVCIVIGNFIGCNLYRL